MSKDGEIEVNWSPWFIDANKLVRQYEYKGTSETGNKFQIHCTVKRAKIFEDAGFPDLSISNHTGFYLFPKLDYLEGKLLFCLTTEDGSIDTGFFPVKVTSVQGDATLIFIESEKDNRSVVKILKSGKDAAFKLADDKETFIFLPIPNDKTFSQLHLKLEKELK